MATILYVWSVILDILCISQVNWIVLQNLMCFQFLRGIALMFVFLQDDARSFALLGSTPSPSSKSEDSSITPPEAWGGEKLSDKFALLRQPLNMASRYGMSTSSGLTSSSMYSGLQDVSLSQTSISSLTDSNPSRENMRTKDVTSYQETSSLGFPEHLSSSFPSLSLGTKGILGSGNLDSSRPSSLTLTHREPRRTYAERISTTSGTSLSVGSPKTKKTGAETKEELLSNFLSRSDTSAVVEPGIPPAINVRIPIHSVIVCSHT